MADRRNNVIVLPGREGADSRQPASIDILRTTVLQLDELGYWLQQVPPHPNWPAERWMIASTPFRMRLTGVRKRLSDLAALDSAGEESDIRWTFEFNDARLGAERQLHDIDTCLRTLQDGNASAAERTRETGTFASSRFELLKVLDKIRHLLSQRCLAVLNES